MHTNQKEHTVSEFEQFVKCPSPPRPEAGRFHMVPRSTATIHEYAKGQFVVGAQSGRRVSAAIHTSPEELVQVASDALLLAEHLEERQSALQDAEASQKATEGAQVEKEAQALCGSINTLDWDTLSRGSKELYIKMAHKAREIHGVNK